MHTAWQHTWRLYDAIATPHTEQAAASTQSRQQAAGSTPLRRTQQRSFTPKAVIIEDTHVFILLIKSLRHIDPPIFLV